MRRCRRCQSEKAIDQFGKDSSRKDGIETICRACRCVAAKERYKRDPAKHIERTKLWRLSNPGACTESHARWLENNRARVAELQRIRSEKWYAKHGEKMRINVSEWKRKNAWRVNATNAARAAAKRKATPLWANRDVIAAIYKEAVAVSLATGIPHHVDHIVPLRGKSVCGLHCEANLAVIPASENISKKHHVWPGM